MGVWTDTRAGTEASRKQDIVAARVTYSQPARMSEPVEAVLRYGGIALALLGLALSVSALAGSRGRTQPNGTEARS